VRCPIGHLRRFDPSKWGLSFQMTYKLGSAMQKVGLQRFGAGHRSSRLGRLIERVGVCMLAMILSGTVSGCRSLALRYEVPSIAQGELSPAAADRLVAESLERQSPPQLDRPLRVIRLVLPDYPTWVVRQHEGVVVAKFTIGPKGDVVQVSGRPDDDPRLLQLVTDALMSWRFEPPQAAGLPTSVTLRFPIRFEGR